jgi:hypothetical protein
LAGIDPQQAFASIGSNAGACATSDITVSAAAKKAHLFDHLVGALPERVRARSCCSVEWPFSLKAPPRSGHAHAITTDRGADAFDDPTSGVSPDRDCCGRDPCGATADSIGVFFWEFLVYLIEGMVFLITGLQARTLIVGIRDYSIFDLAVSATLVSAVVIIARFAWMLSRDPCPALAHSCGQTQGPLTALAVANCAGLHRRPRHRFARGGARDTVHSGQR